MVKKLLQQRGKTHGDFTDNARISQGLKWVMKTSKNWEELSDVQKEGLEMIVHKIARALSGDPKEIDNYSDIAGYATLIEERTCKGK